jgi:hypothetical protein
LILASRIALLPIWRGFETATRTHFGRGDVAAYFSLENIAAYSKICLGICQVIAMFEVTTKIRQMDERSRKPQRQQKQDERDTDLKMQKWLYGLLITTALIASANLASGVLKKVARNNPFWSAVNIAFFSIDSWIFFAITVGLIYSSFLVIYRLKTQRTFKKHVIKDKCAMFAMTSVFTLSYFLRSVFMLTEPMLMPSCCNGCYENGGTSKQMTYFNLLYLVQLPVTDCVPILVILLYHLMTMRNSKVYEVPVEQAAKTKAKVERLYSFEETETEADERNFEHENIEERFLSETSCKKSKTAAPTNPSKQNNNLNLNASEHYDNNIENEIGHHDDDFYNTQVHPDDVSMMSSFMSAKSDDHFNYENARKQSGWLRNSSD